MATVAPEHIAAPVPAPATPVTLPAGHRLAPARVGRPGSVQTIAIPCPAWCSQDHVDDWQYDVEDIEHYGPMFGVQVSTILNDTALYEWYGRVNSDPGSSDPRLRAAHVLVGDCSREDAQLTPDMTDELADELIAFGLKLRAAARTARLANQAAA
jgi:hypothetical protein